MVKDHKFYTEPFSHQRSEFSHSLHKPNYAVLWEQGCGKSKLLCDQFTWLSNNDEIDGVLIVAPNGVHRNWIVDQIPQHCDPASPIKTFLWQSSKAQGKEFKAEFDEMLEFPQLAVFAINYDALITERGYKACEKFLKKRQSMMLLDESHRIKSPTAKRTKNAIKLGRMAKYRRILTGTPIGNSPFDAFSQFAFLDPNILGYKSFFVFKNRFGLFEQKFNGAQRYLKLLQYRNLDELQALMKPHSSRVLKADVLDLPDKLYTKRYFDMSAEQQRVYSDLREEYMVELKSGEVITAQLALVRLLRLQQITCGYLPTGGDVNERIGDGANPRLAALLDCLEDYPDQKTIIFARFREDIAQIMAALPVGSAVSYFGDTTGEERGAAIVRFTSDPSCRYFVANPQTASEGLNLQCASVVVYYSNSFKLLERMQSEDRAHRWGQKNVVTYIDIVAPGTVDDRIVGALRDKKNLAAVVTGDNFTQWI